MANYVTFDTEKRLIEITKAPDVNGEVLIDVKIDIYSDGKEDWLASSDLMKIEFPIESVGGNVLSEENYIASAFILKNDWKIKPYNSNHKFILNGNIFSDDDTDIFVATDDPHSVVIKMQVSNLIDFIVQQLPAIEYGSFNGGVTVSTISPYSGTTYPIGTPQQPVNNWTDALAIASERGFTNFFVACDCTLTSELDFTSMSFIGLSATRSSMVIGADANVTDCEFSRMTISGTLDGDCVLQECIIDTLTYVRGYIHNCILNPGIITLYGTGTAHFLDCWSGVTDGVRPTIDCNDTGQNLVMRNYNGEIKISNVTSPDVNIGIDLNSGNVILDSSITAGIVTVRGVGTIENNATGTSDVDTFDLLSSVSISKETWESSTEFVYIDMEEGSSGTSWPKGTPQDPVNNVSDALTIANSIGIKAFKFKGVFLLSEDYDGWKFEGWSSFSNDVIVITGQNVVNSAFHKCAITGAFGPYTYNNTHNMGICSDLAGFSGIIITVALYGTFGVGSEGTFFGGSDLLGATQPTIIDMVGGNRLATFASTAGDYLIKNLAAGSHMNISLNTGYIIVDSSCTGGSIVIEGSANVTDNSGGAVTVTNQLINPITISESTWTHSTATELIGDIDRSLGLMQENFVMDQQTYADYYGAQLLTGARIRTYTDETLETLLATYQVTAVWSEGKCISYQVVRV